MKSSCARATIAVAIAIVALSAPVVAEKRTPIEKFRARAINLDRGGASSLDIVIYEWTTPEERQALLQTLVEGGSRALSDALEDQGEKAYVKHPQTLGYDMKYAWQLEHGGTRRIVLATDRPMGFLELARNTRSTDFNVSLIVLELDPKTGEGEGSAVGGAELAIDEETGQLDIKIRGTRPTRLTKVKPLKIKKKKGAS